MTEEQLEVTSAAEWREARVDGYLLTLPSGKVIRIRPVAVDALMVAGEIPDVLTPLVTKLIYAVPDDDKAESNADHMSYEDNLQNIRLMNIIVKAALVEPRICDQDCDDCEDCILVEDIDFNDRVEIQNISLLPAEALKKFCEKQAQHLELISDGEDIQQETE